MRPHRVSFVVPLRPRAATAEEFAEIVLAYRLLQEASNEARNDGLWPREASLGYSWLLDSGVGPPMLLWLLYQGQIDHLEVEPSPAPGQPPVPKPNFSAVFMARSAVALTAAGEPFAQALRASFLPGCAGEVGRLRETLRVGDLTPRYDRRARLLSWGRHALKRYAQPSENQERVLLAAEEHGWPPWLDDPLPTRHDLCPKARLHDAVKNLNRRQRPRLIRFKGDGTGGRVGWELR